VLEVGRVDDLARAVSGGEAVSIPSWITPPPDFGPLFSQPTARATDPKTSHDAAKRASGSAGQHRAAIVEALGLGPAGQTEIARRTGLTVAAVSKRLCELRRAGVIVRVGDATSATGGREAAYGRATDGRRQEG
jgi:hypothetical protein